MGYVPSSAECTPYSSTLTRLQEWGTLFGSTSFVLDSAAPLWFATFNNVEVRCFIVYPNAGCSPVFMLFHADAYPGHTVRRVSCVPACL